MRIATEYAADLKDAAQKDVTQYSQEYTVSNYYELRFKPTAVVRAVNDNAATVKIALTYPKQVTPEFDLYGANENKVVDFEDNAEKASK